MQNHMHAISSRALFYADVHTYGPTWTSVYGYAVNLFPPNYSMLLRAMQAAQSAAQRVNGLVFSIGTDAGGVYPSSGGSDDYAYIQAGIQAGFTIELRGDDFVVPPSDILLSGLEFQAGLTAMTLQLQSEQPTTSTTAAATSSLEETTSTLEETTSTTTSTATSEATSTTTSSTTSTAQVTTTLPPSTTTDMATNLSTTSSSASSVLSSTLATTTAGAVLYNSGAIIFFFVLLALALLLVVSGALLWRRRQREKAARAAFAVEGAEDVEHGVELSVADPPGTVDLLASEEDADKTPDDFM
jgi:hypothetical protein